MSFNLLLLQSFCIYYLFSGFRDLEIPMRWETSRDIIHYKKSQYTQEGTKLTAETSDNTSILEDFKVSDRLSLMKFYALSSGMVSQLLSSCDGTELELPFELTNQEMKIIHFNKSSFILGRSGTGKTTVIIRKLFQKEQRYHIALKGFHDLNGYSSKDLITEDGERVKETKEDFLRQIFVTLNPRLCCAVKHQVSGLRRCVHIKSTRVSTLNSEIRIGLPFIFYLFIF